jgi:peroxiredoxin
MAVRMSKKAWLTVAVVIVVGATVGITLSHTSCSPSDSTLLSQNATDFTLPTMTGDNITLSQLQGTPVVLNFWSVSCAYCRAQLHYLEAVAQQSEGEIEVIAINMIDNAASVQAFFGDYEPIMIIALDVNREIFADYCQKYGNPRTYVPFTLFVDNEGMVQYVRVGAFASEAALWQTVNDVLGITVPQTS